MPFYCDTDNRTLIFEVLEGAVCAVSEATFGAPASRSLALQAVMGLRIKFAIGEGESDPRVLKRLALEAIEHLY